MMKKILALFLALVLCLGAACAAAEDLAKKSSSGESSGESADSSSVDLSQAVTAESVYQLLSESMASIEGLDDETKKVVDAVCLDISGEWRRTYDNPEYKIWCAGRDDPSQLPIAGTRHAFVVLGFQLVDGEMAPELKSRCDAAVEAANAFPDSILVCSGGPTGENNPDKHTEAGLMKQYLVEKGIAPERIFIDEQALTTAENAMNTFAILQENGIKAMTIVTSSYHQRRAHMLYYTVQAFRAMKEAPRVDFIGNYSFETEDTSSLAGYDPLVAEFQIIQILGSLLQQ